MTKRQCVVGYLMSGEYKKALKIAKDFFVGFSKDELKKVQIAYECFVHEDFYKMLGRNINESIEEGVSILKEKFAVIKND